MKQVVPYKLVIGEKDVTNKEHQHIMKQFEKTIEETNVLLRRAGLQFKVSQSHIQTNQINFQSSKSGRGKTDIRPRATI
jgi:hypothetical protein